jgi:carbon storage regulator
MLILTRKEDESIIIGNDIEVSVVDIKGDQVKLGIKAPKEIKVYRREVFTAIQKENLAAAKAGTSLPDIGFVQKQKGAGEGSDATSQTGTSTRENQKENEDAAPGTTTGKKGAGREQGD